MTHDECVGRWTPPPHHPKILPYKHHPIKTLLLTCVCPLVPSALIRDKWKSTWQMERVEGLVIVGQYFWVVRRVSPETDTFIMRHEDLPNMEIYDTKRMVHIKEEGLEEDLFDLERP